MLAKSIIIPSAALIVGLLGNALPALAEYDYDLYGCPHQTWCDVNPDCNGWNKQARARPPIRATPPACWTPLNPASPSHAQPRRQGPLSRHAALDLAGPPAAVRRDGRVTGSAGAGSPPASGCSSGAMCDQV